MEGSAASPSDGAPQPGEGGEEMAGDKRVHAAVDFQQQQGQQAEAYPPQAQQPPAAVAASEYMPPEKKQRPLEDGYQGGLVPTMQVRILVGDKSVGGIIGKKGVTINKLRSDTGCHVDVAKGVPGTTTRVITASGRVDSLGVLLLMITNNIQEHKRQSMYDAQATEPASNYTITLLVERTIVGAMIGKGGATINNTRVTSGANVQVSEKSLGNSTEKSVKITGTIQAVEIALSIILSQLLEKADKGVTIPYVPMPEAYGSAYGAAMGQPPYGAAAYGQQPGAYGGGAYGMGVQAPTGFSSSPYGPQTTLTMEIPEPAVGNVIGRGGSSIQEIRARSGAHIQIPKGEHASVKRTVTITGTSVANELAASLINAKIQEALLNPR